VILVSVRPATCHLHFILVPTAFVSCFCSKFISPQLINPNND
jgi:hypothetical protein